MFATFIAHCAENRIHGKWGARFKGYYWIARIMLPTAKFYGVGRSRGQALDRASGIALKFLTEPEPPPTMDKHAAWRYLHRTEICPTHQH